MRMLSDANQREIIAQWMVGELASVVSPGLFKRYPELPPRPPADQNTIGYMDELLHAVLRIPPRELHDGEIIEQILIARNEQELRVFVGVGSIVIKVLAEPDREIAVHCPPGPGFEIRSRWLADRALKIACDEDPTIQRMAAQFNTEAKWN